MRLFVNNEELRVVLDDAPTNETFKGDPIALLVRTSSQAHPNLYIHFGGVWYIAQMSPMGCHSVRRLSASRLVNATTYRNVMRWKDSTPLSVLSGPQCEWEHGGAHFFVDLKNESF